MRPAAAAANADHAAAVADHAATVARPLRRRGETRGGEPVAAGLVAPANRFFALSILWGALAASALAVHSLVRESNFTADPAFSKQAKSK
eukprot:CAMPEP_0204237474 /NCGR_PEP_ID=MMETSP0361-20130328/93286_1 /ASSEMBLY_ACC=CAM_ASM_000343 /TAXON_ID=268821 /ORGANISM="Scrippsiella Hangoei, Strain SHTV-5" /LENGTH=89 /DNA_ID=CAMNT_0051210047 /DNA_START=66 /DNA_END=337 /DNA_ORIENTATION=-